MPGWRAEAGLSPRRATHFSLLRQRKVSKRKATPSLRPLRFATGRTCGGAVAGCAVELALRLRAPLGQPRRVRSRSTRAPTRVPPRNRPAAGAASRGWTAKQPNSHMGHRLLGPAFAGASASRCESSAERSEAMARVDVRSPGSLLYAPGARRARGGTRVGARVLRGLTHRSCLSGARQRAASSAVHPVTEHSRLPRSAAKGSQNSRVAFSLVPFFWRPKRKGLACRATPGLRPPPKHAPHQRAASAPRFRRTQPERDKSEVKKSKTIAASARQISPSAHFC
jgi:hypothetical protein